MPKESSDQYSPEETERRVRATLRGAFNHAPTPLKEVPKRNGKPRASRVKRAMVKPKSQG